ncbi:MAG: hypothetical protein ACE5JS_14935 [Nitrospinota bacterium]
MQLWPVFLACILRFLLRRVVLPRRLNHCSSRRLRVKLVKMGGKIGRNARHVLFQLGRGLPAFWSGSSDRAGAGLTLRGGFPAAGGVL